MSMPDIAVAGTGCKQGEITGKIQMMSMNTAKLGTATECYSWLMFNGTFNTNTSYQRKDDDGYI